MKDKTTVEKFIETLENPYDMSIAICMAQFKGLIDIGDYENAQKRLEWVKEFSKLHNNNNNLYTWGRKA